MMVLTWFLGYSVFAVVQADPVADLALQRTEADIIAATIPEPESDDPPSASEGAASGSGGGGEHVDIPEDTEELEDNDMELQAALQASLTGGEFGFAWDANEAGPTNAPVRAPLPPGFPPLAPSMQSAPFPGFNFGDAPEPENESDPVAASMVRNRAMLERMRREQEMALRETYDAEVAAGFQPGGRAATGVGGGVGHAEEGHDEDEQIRRALAASLEGGDERHPILVDDDDDDDEGSEKENIGVRGPARPTAASSTGSVPPNTAVLHDRVYDDEDQAFQAALKASLESMPPGFVPPATPPRPSQPSLSAVAATTPGPSSGSQLPPANTTSMNNDDDEEYKPEDASSPAPAPPEQLSMEEIRRRRLAKFGG